MAFFDGDDDGDDDGEDVVKEYGKTSAVGDDEDDADSKAGKAGWPDAGSIDDNGARAGITIALSASTDSIVFSSFCNPAPSSSTNVSVFSVKVICEPDAVSDLKSSDLSSMCKGETAIGNGSRLPLVISTLIKLYAFSMLNKKNIKIIIVFFIINPQKYSYKMFGNVIIINIKD